MQPADFILVPLTIVILYFFFRSRRKRYDDPLLKKYHRQGFWIKILASLLFVLYYSYMTLGDSTVLYQHEGNHLYHLILDNASNARYLFKSGKNFDLSLVDNPYNRGYFSEEGNFMVIRLDAIFSFIALGSYAVINLIFAALAFSGLWKLFLFFYGQHPKLHKQFAIAVLYFPSLAFWSSGLLKDTLCIAALGWFTFALYSLVVKRKSRIKNTLVVLIAAYFLVILKVYILLAYFPFFALFLLFSRIQRIEFRLLRFLLAPVLVLGLVYSFSRVLSYYNDSLGAYAVNDLTSSISHLNEVIEQRSGREDAASNFSLGEQFDGTFSGLVRIAPLATGTTFFRPFIWEAHKISQLMAAFESLILMFFSLYVLLRGGLLNFIRGVFTDPLIMYCFFFAVVFGMFVGASTLNFGTLVRYKIPCLPFFTISLILIYQRAREKAAQRKWQEQEEVRTTAWEPALG